LPFSETSAAASTEYSRLLHLHLAEKTSVIGSSLLRQFSINAVPTLLIKIYEFQIIQATPTTGPPQIFGLKISPKKLLTPVLRPTGLLTEDWP